MTKQRPFIHTKLYEPSATIIIQQLEEDFALHIPRSSPSPLYLRGDIVSTDLGCYMDLAVVLDEKDEDGDYYLGFYRQNDSGELVFNTEYSSDSWIKSLIKRPSKS